VGGREEWTRGAGLTLAWQLSLQKGAFVSLPRYSLVGAYSLLSFDSVSLLAMIFFIVAACFIANTLTTSEKCQGSSLKYITVISDIFNPPPTSLVGDGFRPEYGKIVSGFRQV